MSDRLLRIAMIVGFIVLVCVLGYGIYWFFFYQPQPTAPAVAPVGVPTEMLPVAGIGTTTVSGEIAMPPVGLPSAATSALVVPTNAAQGALTRTLTLTEESLQAPSGALGGGVRAYNPKDGKFYKISDQGTLLTLSDKAFPNVSKVTWGNQTDKAILEYPDRSKIFYDFAQQKQVTLPKHWEDFAFSPQDNRVATKSIGNDSSNRFLVTANPDGTNAKIIEELGDNQNKVHVSWSPSDQIVAYSFTGNPVGFDEQEIILVGQNHENFKGLLVPGRGFIPSWSPDGKNMLYSVYQSTSGFRPTLWVSGALGDSINANRTNLEINTWADKCAWQNTEILVCAVPEQLPEGAALQRDLVSFVPDHIYKIDLRSGVKMDLGKPDGNPTVDQITLSPDGRSAYLHDQNYGKILKFSL